MEELQGARSAPQKSLQKKPPCRQCYHRRQGGNWVIRGLLIRPAPFDGLVSSRLLSTMVSTPSASFAFTVFSSMVGGRVKLRRNRL